MSDEAWFGIFYGSGVIIATILWLRLALENDGEDITVGTFTAAFMWGLTSWGSVLFFSTIPIMKLLGKLGGWWLKFTHIVIVPKEKRKK